MVNFLKIFEKFFLHRPSGVLELRERVRPDGAAPFLHRLCGTLELPQAGSPFPGGEFFAEPQQGDSPSVDGGNVPRPAAGTTPYQRRWAKRKGHLRFPFLFELLPFPCFLIRRRFPICDRFENRERQSGYLSVSFSAFSQFTDSVLLHMRVTQRRARHTRAAQILGTL